MEILMVFIVLIGLFCIVFGMYLLSKKVTGKTEIEIKGIGKLKTTQTGLVVIFLGVVLICFSIGTFTYIETQKQKINNLSVSLQKNKDLKLNTERYAEKLKTEKFDLEKQLNIKNQFVEKLIAEGSSTITIKGTLAQHGFCRGVKCNNLIVKLDQPIKEVKLVAIREGLNQEIGKQVEIKGIPVLKAFGSGGAAVSPDKIDSHPLEELYIELQDERFLEKFSDNNPDGSIHNAQISDAGVTDGGISDISEE